MRTRSRPLRGELDQGIPMASPIGLLDGTLLAGLDCLASLGLPTGACLVLPLPTGAQLGTLGLG